MGRPSAAARFLRSGCMPWPCDHTVRWPSRNSASAQDGAHRGVRDVGPRDGDLHRGSWAALSAARRADAPVLGSAGPSARPPSCCAGVRCAARCPSLACSGAAAAAACATLSTGLTKATKLASRTICKLALGGAADRGLVERRQRRRRGWAGAACGHAARSSGTHVVHEGGAAHLRRQVDARHAAGRPPCRTRPASAGAVPVTAWREIDLAARPSSSPGRSPRRSAGTGRRPPSSSSRLQLSRSAARSSALARTSAQTSRTEPPDISIDSDDVVYISSGPLGRCRPTARRRARAARRARRPRSGRCAVTTPWPISTLPVAMRTVRSGWKRIQRSSRGLSTRLAGRAGALMPASRCAARRRRVRPRAGCADGAPQRQRCLSSAATISAAARAWDCGRAAPWPTS